MIGALRSLHLRPDTRVLAVSPLYRSEPVGPPQPDYLNGCAAIETQLAPHQLRLEIKRLEAEHGRDHSADRWSARPLDLDILLYDRLELADRWLTIPHPELYRRNFVLVPLLDLDADLQLPDGRRLDTLRRQVPAGDLELSMPSSELMQAIEAVQR